MGDSELLAAFRACTDEITRYYRALGDPRTCQNSNGLWFPDAPGLLIDFVPEIAQDGIERLATAAGITVRKNDGGRGKQAYFTFMAGGLTPEKLNDLTERVRAETERLTATRASGA